MTVEDIIKELQGSEAVDGCWIELATSEKIVTLLRLAEAMRDDVKELASLGGHIPVWLKVRCADWDLEVDPSKEYL